LAFSPADAIASDPEIYPDADKFDGMRFYNLRQASADQNKYQFTSISNTQMSFGGGRHACPGRWFANYEIKLVIANLLCRYEFKLDDRQGRPKSILFQFRQFLDPNAKILLRSLKP